MASEVKVDKLSQKGSSGIVISDDIKLSADKAIKNAAGTALLTQAGVLDNVSLGSSVTGLPASVIVKRQISTKSGSTAFSSGSTGEIGTILTFTYTPDGNLTDDTWIGAVFHITVSVLGGGGTQQFAIATTIAGSDLVGTYGDTDTHVSFLVGKHYRTIPMVHLDGTGHSDLTFTFKLNSNHVNNTCTIDGDGTVDKTHCIVTEYINELS